MNRFFLALLCAFTFLSCVAQKKTISVSHPSGAAQLTERGRQQLRHDSLPEAIKTFTEAIAADSTYLDARYERATAYYTLMQYTQGGADDAFLYRKKYMNPVVYARLAQLYMTKKQTAEAMTVYREGIALMDTSALLHLQLGNLLLQTDKFDEAASHLQRTLDLKTPETAELYTNLGYSLSRSGDQSRALIYLTKAISLKPDTREAYAFRGFVLLQMHKFDLAESDYLYYLQEQPMDVTAQYNLGRCQFEQKKYDAALKTFREVENLQPAYLDCYYLMGMCYAGMNDYKTALTWLDKAIAQNPSKAIYYFNRGIAKGHLIPRGDYCPDFRKALELGFQDAQGMIDMYCK